MPPPRTDPWGTSFSNVTLPENAGRFLSAARFCSVQNWSFPRTMSRMLELIRACALPSHQMMTAAKGALSVPAEEMVEILVYLSGHNPIFGEQAQLTLAAWDETSAKKIVAGPTTPPEILDYWLSPRNLRPGLFPLLLENESVPTAKLSVLASNLKGEWIDAMLASPRVRNSPQVSIAMQSNQYLGGTQAARLRELLAGPVSLAGASPPETSDGSTPIFALPGEEAPPSMAESHPQIGGEPGAEAAVESPEVESALISYFTQHANEIAAEANAPFTVIGGMHDDLAVEDPPKAVATAASAMPAQAPVIVKPAKKLVNPQDQQRGSVLQKISKLDIKGRIQLAMKGNKEERSILIRDGTKIVALAVLDSPKISDGEVEKFSSQRNVLEAVLRAIPMKRRFVKNYPVVRNLVFNPRTPMDVSLGLMKNLLIQDLRNLAGNKEVADTIRKLAFRHFQQKTNK